MSTLAITTIQTQLHWEDKAANLRMFEEKINSIQDKIEVVVLPEMFTTGFSMKPEVLAENMDGSTVQWMKKIAAAKNIVLTGSVIIEDDGNYYNRLIWMLPNGDVGYYDKRHRFAYAGEDQHYAAGKNRLIASVKGWRINLQICYDLRFPVWGRQSPQPKPTDGQDHGPSYAEYDVLIYVANWPDRRAHAWKTLLQARAIENQCYVVGVNRIGKDENNNYYSGDSMVVDAMGEIMHTKANEEDIHTTNLQKDKLEAIRNKLPFLKDADRFFIEP
jgi:predicted amidohydrolase